MEFKKCSNVKSCCNLNNFVPLINNNARTVDQFLSPEKSEKPWERGAGRRKYSTNPGALQTGKTTVDWETESSVWGKNWHWYT